jgi:hypothetical protein
MALKMWLLIIFQVLTVCLHTLAYQKNTQKQTPEQIRTGRHVGNLAMIWIRPLRNLVANGKWATVNFKP